jgi:hypothetical protein
VLYRVYVGRVELNPTVSAGWILIARRPDVGVSGTRGRRDVNVESLHHTVNSVSSQKFTSN